MDLPGNARVSRERIYHDRGKRRQVLEQDRPFIAWDGEGVNIWGSGKPQAYVLFGNSADGSIESPLGLSTWECIEYIVASGKRHPTAIHVGFAFGYDSNMIVSSLSPTTLFRLHKKGFVKLRRNGAEYTVTYRKAKYFQVSWYVPGSPRTSKVTVRIYDIFTFFMTSFVKAYEDMIGPVQEILTSGKAARKQFTISELPTIREYWNLEIQNVRELAEELRRRVYAAGLPITEWHGPGALASLSMKQHNIKLHMKRLPDEIRLASRYAYAAGRFELYKVGRILGPVYGIDLNSAYPHALRKVPSLTEGKWEYSSNPRSVKPFGLYHVQLRRGSLVETRPSPLYLRDRHHELYFPWHTEGWWWGPETAHAVREGAHIVEAWEYTGWETLPFAYVGDMYEQRKQWKREKNSAQMALKLCMNAMTGKAAQRVGYDEETGRIPGWHQLEWAGWVTSSTRAAMYNLMAKIPFDKLIAIETDGIYTTMSPAELGVTESDELGGWSVDVYDEVMYVQSGLAWLRRGDCQSGCSHSAEEIRRGFCAWTQKRRGLDWDSFTLDQCVAYMGALEPGSHWPPYVGKTTRFTTMGKALVSKSPLERHCVWSVDKREISTGHQGKRVHVPAVCRACQAGLDGYAMAHDLAISPKFLKSGPHSYPHEIPWEDNDGESWWRARQVEEDGYLHE